MALTIVYEAALFILGFLRGVGQKTWAQLGPELEALAVGWAVNLLRDAFSRFRRKYKKRIYEEFNYFNVRGLTLLNTFTLDLNEVFVDLRVSSTSAGSAALLRHFPPDTTEGSSLWDFLRYEQTADRSRKALAITGPPGSGKTTLLQHVALIFAKNRQRTHRLRPKLPILLFIREHSSDIAKTDPTLGAAAEAHFNRAYWTLKPPKGWFERQLRKRRSIVLLDGLDEVADSATRQAVANWIDRQIANYPLARFLITARPQGYRDAPLRRADVLEVMPFKPEQVERFVRQWYSANALIAAGGKRSAAHSRRAVNDAADLLRRLTATPALESMTVNPLLLTMITMVHKFRGALPGSRVELYDEICEVLLGRWRQAKGIDENLKTEQKRLALQPLAAFMMSARKREIATADAVHLMTPVLERLGIEPTSQFLYYIQETSGLLQEKEAGMWTFAHLTFQEFLAASHWSKAGPPDDWSSFVIDAWWHETIRLYVAKGDATAVVEACLVNGGVSAFVLAAECLDEAAEIDLGTRRRAMQWLDTSLNATDSTQRVIAAEVKLRRRLKSFQRISSQADAYIDPEYLTNAEYEYFLQRRRDAIRAALQPRHWTQTNAPSTKRRDPVEGLGNTELSAFITFVKNLDVGISTYRLPSPSEVDAVPALRSATGTVCMSGDIREIRGLVAFENQNIVQTIEALHLEEEPRVPMPELAALSVDTDFRSYGTRHPFLRLPDEAFSRAIDADVHELVLASCRILINRDEHATTSSAGWARSTLLKIVRGRKRSLYITGVISRQLDQVVSAVTRDEFRRAQTLVATLGTAQRMEDTRLCRILNDLLTVNIAVTQDDAEYCARHALARIMLYTYFGYETGWKSLRRLLGNDSDAGPPRTLILYWFLLVVNERSRGTSIPFDCVRLVKERVTA